MIYTAVSAVLIPALSRTSLTCTFAFITLTPLQYILSGFGVTPEIKNDLKTLFCNILDILVIFTLEISVNVMLVAYSFKLLTINLL